jgi:hypothetical protein
MSTPPTAKRKARRKRSSLRTPLRKLFAAGLAAIVPAIPLASFFVPWRVVNGAYPLLAYALFGLGGLISLGNFYLSFVRYPLLMLRGRTSEEIEFVSGFPLLGMLVLPGLLLAPASPLLSATALVMVLADTGNLSWFVFAVWKDAALWET